MNMIKGFYFPRNLIDFSSFRNSIEPYICKAFGWSGAKDKFPDLDSRNPPYCIELWISIVHCVIDEDCLLEC